MSGGDMYCSNAGSRRPSSLMLQPVSDRRTLCLCTIVQPRPPHRRDGHKYLLGSWKLRDVLLSTQLRLNPGKRAVCRIRYTRDSIAVRTRSVKTASLERSSRTRSKMVRLSIDYCSIQDELKYTSVYFTVRPIQLPISPTVPTSARLHMHISTSDGSRSSWQK